MERNEKGSKELLVYSESGHVHCSALILEPVVALCNASIGGSRADPNAIFPRPHDLVHACMHACMLASHRATEKRG